LCHWRIHDGFLNPVSINLIHLHEQPMKITFRERKRATTYWFHHDE
jgi:hypothetical protein